MLDRLAQNLLEAWNDHDVDRIAGLYDARFVGMDVNQAAPYHGPDGAAEAARTVLKYFPDLSLSGDCLVMQDDAHFAALWTVCGTHAGGPLSIPSTGKSVRLRGASFFEVEGEKIIRATHVWDLAGLLRTLGLLPDL